MGLPIMAIAKVAKSATAAAKAAKAAARAKRLASTFGNKSKKPTPLVPKSSVNYNAMGDAIKNA